jgi:hypothetical protein
MVRKLALSSSSPHSRTIDLAELRFRDRRAGSERRWPPARGAKQLPIRSIQMPAMLAHPDRDRPLVRLLAKDALSDAILRFGRGADSSDLELMRSAYWPAGIDPATRPPSRWRSAVCSITLRGCVSSTRSTRRAQGALALAPRPALRRTAGLGLRFSWGGHGLCSWNGEVYIGTPDGRLIALDGKAGKLV